MAHLADWQHKFGIEGLTFDDVLLLPAASDVLPGEVSTAAWLTRDIALNIPILSAAMDTVTEGRMAIALAREGGLGVVHRNLSIVDQAREVDKVKRSESGMITDPFTLQPHQLLRDAQALMAIYHISGIPITDEQGKLVGILTNRDMRFETNLMRPISEIMTVMPLITVPVGTTLEEANSILRRSKVEKLPVVDDDGVLRGLITVKDIQKKIQYPNATKDSSGRLRVGAAVGVGPDHNTRIEALIAEDVDVIVIDTSHGHSHMVVDTVRQVRRDFGEQVQILAGNVATAEATVALIEAGAAGVKVGIGPGCLAAGTRILMADATYKNIEDVQIGDRVINMHGQAVNVVNAWCTGVREVMAVRHSASDRETIVTPDHRYYLAEFAEQSAAAITTQGRTAVLERPGQVQLASPGWKEIGATRDDVCLLPAHINFELPTNARFDPSGLADDTQHNEAFQISHILSCRLLDGVMPVYDIEVDCPTHSFIADNAIVHNSICTTRIVTGVGVPQISAIYECARAAAPYGVPVIADGGIQYSGDIAKAIAAGADTVMLGSLLAGTDESPGELMIDQGVRFKEYRGMGSIGAMKQRSYSKDRYFQDGTDESKLIAEGIEGRVPFKGPLTNIVVQLIGGVRQAMGYCGAPTIEAMQQNTRFIRITSAGLRESHPHDVIIAKEAPNYGMK